MAVTKAEPPIHPHHYYAPLPCQHDQNYALLPFYRPPTTTRALPWRIIIPAAIILLLAALIFLLWPSDPSLKIVRLRLNKLHIHTLPVINIDASLQVTIKVRNVDVYSMDFRSLDVALSYRGKRLGHVRSGEGHVRALASSYVDAELEISGVGVLSDVVYLLEDLARGTVPFDTVTQVSGRLGFLFFGVPLKAKVACEVLVNTKNQTIFRQHCYSEVRNWCGFTSHTKDSNFNNICLIKICVLRRRDEVEEHDEIEVMKNVEAKLMYPSGVQRKRLIVKHNSSIY